MSRLVLCAILAAAVYIGLHSGSPMLALAAICGAFGVASLATGPTRV